MDEKEIGGLVGLMRALQRAPLAALLGVGGGVLIGDLGNRQPLDGDP